MKRKPFPRCAFTGQPITLEHPGVLIIGHCREWRVSRAVFEDRIRQNLGRVTALPGYRRQNTHPGAPELLGTVELTRLLRCDDERVFSAFEAIFGDKIADHFIAMARRSYAKRRRERRLTRFQAAHGGPEVGEFLASARRRLRALESATLH